MRDAGNQNAIDGRYSLGERVNITAEGKRFRCTFIKPGLVSYVDRGADGYELLRKETIDRYLNTMIGQPLIVKHVTTLKPVPTDRVCGKVDKVGFDPVTGWYYCEGVVENDQAREAINTLGACSCGYRVPREFGDAYGPGGREHNIPFVAEIRRLQFHHLAVVDPKESRPRYEDADIYLNSVQPVPVMSFKTIIKRVKEAVAGAAATTVEETGEIAPETMIEIPGVGPVALKDLAADRRNAVEEEEAAAKKKKDDEDEAEKKKKDADGKENTVTADTKIEIAPGVFATVGELVADRQNAVKKKKDDEAAAEIERKNALERGSKSFRVLSEARQTAATEDGIQLAGSPGGEDEALERGRQRYGSAQQVAGGKN